MEVKPMAIDRKEYDKQMKTIKLEEGLTYRFCGKGAGVPGIPAETTAAAAKAGGYTEALKSAVVLGNFMAVTSKKSKAAKAGGS
jgi:hypothetical protein